MQTEEEEEANFKYLLKVNEMVLMTTVRVG
jgi:hypothetical protein